MLTEMQEQQFSELVKMGKKLGSVKKSQILDITGSENEDYEDLVRDLEDEHITIDETEDNEFFDNEENEEDEYFEDSDDMFEEDLKEDPEFADLSNEIENDLKTKDIDEIVSSIVSPTQVDDPIKIYLSEIGQIPLLTTNEEINYSRIVQDGLYAQEKLKAHENHKITLSDEEIEKNKEIVEKGYNARDVLVESNLRLVVSIAKRYLGRGMKFQDLIQEGNMGLLKAVNKFDPQKGFRFSTYATWWIKQSITRAIADQARTIRVPVYMYETINKLVRTQRKLSQELQREPTAEELAAELHMSVEKVQEIQKTAQDPISFDAPIGEEDDSTVGDFIHDSNMLNPLDYTINESFKEEIDAILKTLTPREEKVLRLRFGLVDGKAHTLEDVGKEFGVTRERIRQIESKAIRRLRSPNRRSILSQYHGEID